MIRSRAFGVFVIVIVIAGAACNEEVIALANITGDGTKPLGSSCVISTDCKDGFFCDHQDCSQRTGTCQPFPVSCGEEEHAVCGCDGVTYFNDCLRQAAGVAGAREGECGVGGTECDEEGLPPCPGESVCAHLSGFYKPGSTNCKGKGGRCWLLPATCPPPSHADRWNECDNGEGHCLSTCSAIRSKKWFSRASTCE